METCCNGPVPGWNRTRNRTGNLDPLLTLRLLPSRTSSCHSRRRVLVRRSQSPTVYASSVMQAAYPRALFSVWYGLHLHRRSCSRVVLTTVPNSRVGSGTGSDPEPNRCNGSYHKKTRTVAIGPVLPPKTRHCDITTLAPIKYLSSDCILT